MENVFLTNEQARELGGFAQNTGFAVRLFQEKDEDDRLRTGILAAEDGDGENVRAYRFAGNSIVEDN